MSVTKSSLSLAPSDSIFYRSLNLGFRKKETDRIERENHAFAKRLFDREASLQKSKFDEDYKQH